MTNAYGPKTAPADRLDAMKYREPGESFRECCGRNAFALTDDGTHYEEFREIILDLRFLSAGRIRRAAGASVRVTPYNCFVSGTISDTYVGGGIGDPSSIMGRATEAAATMRMGGGIGYDFSTLRPRDSAILGIGGHSSGPTSFMRIFNEICRATSSAGNRRGAQMGVLRIDHPDVEEFVRAKQNSTELTGFNVSLGITDEFMEAYAAKKPFALRFGGQTYREVDAEDLWEKIMRSNYDWAEPGVLYIDRMNEMNNLYYCETLAATNPCAEQPLPPYGACLLGSFNLPAYLVKAADGWSFDADRLRADVPPVVRAMDNVVDRALYPLAEQEAEARAKRRMGLGVTGLANAAEALGFPYASAEFLAFEDRVLELIAVETYRASANVAAKKGSFPLFDAEKYLDGRFVKTLPEDVRDLIKKNGIRNSHLTSIAPTGTISMLADNVSSGIEPVFAHSVSRPINTPDGPAIERLEDYGAKFLDVRGRLASEVTPREHVDVLVAAQRRVDSAVSKTCNLANGIEWDDFKDVYLRAYDGRAKGCTVYRAGCKREGLMAEDAPLVAEGAACEVVNGARSCE